jgi:two-component system cell cycle sensor histidine kinase/response regulator CckA
LVEDNEQIRSLAATALSELGHIVWEAENGLAALRLVETHSPALDLLVTDVIMPGMSGRQLSDLLVQQYPHLKVLYVSGYSDNEIAPHGILETGVLLLQKPYTPNLLRDKVRETLEN